MIPPLALPFVERVSSMFLFIFVRCPTMYTLQIVLSIIHVDETVIVTIILMENGRVYASFGGREHHAMKVSPAE